MNVMERTAAELVRPRALGANRRGAAVADVEGMAGHQRPRGLLVRHGLGRIDPPVSRAAGRRVANAARSHGHAQLSSGSACGGRTDAVSVPTITDTEAGAEFDASQYLAAFRLETGLPIWTYEIEGVRFEKRVLMPHLQNTTHINYRLLSDEPVRLELSPLSRSGCTKRQ